MSASTSLLIIEDQPDICDLIKLSFTNRIPTIQTAHSIAEASKLIQKSLFTLAIIDACLPDGDPYNIIQKLIQKNCKILLMSGNFQIHKHINELPLPRIEKPFRIKQLLQTVEEILTKPFVNHSTRLVS